MPEATFDAATVELVGRICDESWEQLQATTSPGGAEDVRDKMTCRVLLAVSRGERDQQRLLAVALAAGQI